MDVRLQTSIRMHPDRPPDREPLLCRPTAAAQRRLYYIPALFLCLSIACFVGGGVYFQYGQEHPLTEAQWAKQSQEAQTLCAQLSCLTANNCTDFNAAMVTYLQDDDFVTFACSRGCIAARTNCSEVDRIRCWQQCRDVWNAVKQSESKVADDGATARRQGLWMLGSGAFLLGFGVLNVVYDRTCSKPLTAPR